MQHYRQRQCQFGVSCNGDVTALRDAGMDGCIIGKAWYTGAVDLEQAIREAEAC